MSAPHVAQDNLAADLSEHYPGRWALLLIAVCSPDGPHAHHGAACLSPGKRPLAGDWNARAVARWERGDGRDEHLRDAAAHVGRGGNLGLVVPRGVLVLDADTPDAVAMLDRAIPDAPMQESRSGRAHFVVRVPLDAAIPSTVRQEIASGVFADLRSAGRAQIVVEPSRHVSGSAYTWKRALPENPMDLPEIPAFIAEKIMQREQAEGAASAGSIKPGERNAYLFRVGSGMRGRGLSEPEVREELLRENRRLCSPPLDVAEVDAIVSSVLRYAAGGERVIEGEEDASAAGAGSSDATWPVPSPLPPMTCPAPPLPEDLLPEAFRPWLVDAAERACLPLEFVAIPSLVAAGSVIGRAVGIHPKRRDTGWRVVPNLWGGIVGKPGVLKTPAVEEGLSPLAPLIERAAARFEEERRSIDAQRAGIELRLKQLKSPKGGKHGDAHAIGREIADLERELRETVAVERRYKTHDATVEKLGELLAQNPRGLLLVRDELAGWLLGLDRKGREGERSFFLEAWSGTGSFDFDRIGRGTVRVPSLCMSIMGSIQPGRLRPFLEEALGEQSGADGLVQRFQLLVWPDTTPEWRNVDREPDAAARARVDRVFDALDRVKGRDLPGVPEGTALGPLAIPCLRFAPEAQALFDVWRDGLERRVREPGIEQTPAFASHLAKYRSLMPSLALVFALVDGAEGGFVGIGGGIPLEAAQRAAAWCEYLEQHARKLYAVELNPAATAAHALARKIRDGLLHDGMTLRDVERAEWSGLTRDAAVRDGIELLERLGWVRLERRGPGPEGGRPSGVIRVNPAVREVAS